MTREEARKAAEVMLAYANGEEIEAECLDGKYRLNGNPSFNWKNTNYRIRPKPTYRPFKNMDECWNEMHKHPDFGWLVNKNSKSIYHINVICCDDLCLDETSLNYAEAFTYYEFLDGSHFGIKEE